MNDKIPGILASAMTLALVLLPTVSAQSESPLSTVLQSGPPEQPDPNDGDLRCHHLERTIPNCQATFYAVDLWLWAANFAVYCFQNPSQCSLADVPTPALGGVEAW